MAISALAVHFIDFALQPRARMGGVVHLVQLRDAWGIRVGDRHRPSGARLGAHRLSRRRLGRRVSTAPRPRRLSIQRQVSGRYEARRARGSPSLRSRKGRPRKPPRGRAADPQSRVCGARSCGRCRNPYRKGTRGGRSGRRSGRCPARLRKPAGCGGKSRVQHRAAGAPPLEQIGSAACARVRTLRGCPGLAKKGANRRDGACGISYGSWVSQ